MCYYEIFCQNNLNLFLPVFLSLDATDMSRSQFSLNNLNMVCFIYAICFHAFTKCILFCFILKRNAIHVRRRHRRRRSAVNVSQYENKNCIFMKYDLKRI